ncbi:LTA synthase family protein [Bdellovibrio svalbardensis]|uniref:Sulfatase n=1 Tax=Bdellovibrio svalbardensis TaxID=2972972 RepID=A0ABT6DK75_9BACT|nr:hypothetical protein [Bdellovibrio svalbardensis]MDG0817260.1 hypothetical protein [Bdellovibrio svalbardensis]
MKLLKLSIAMIFFMTLFRMNLFFLNVYYVLPELNPGEIMQSFIAGLRFDILVFGFLFIPIYFLVLLQATLEKWPPNFFFVYKTYFGLAWIAICSLTFVDFFFFAHHGKRMRFAEYSGWSPEVTFEQAQTLPINQWIVFTVISIVLLVLGHMLIKSLKFGEWKDEYSPHPARRGEVLLRILIPLILIVLAARGSVMPHHLALEHSEVSNSKELNEMALNAVWCFDK